MKTLLAALALAACLCAQAPNYPADGIVNGAGFTSGPLAPNTIVSLFGTNLSWSTEGITDNDIVDNTMPTKLAGVEVYVAGYLAHLYYVSPLQINALIPNFLRPGVVQMWVTRDGMAGPKIDITIQDAAPGLFVTPALVPIATHLDYSLVTGDSPAHASEIVILYAGGLGCLQGNPIDGSLIPSVDWLCQMDQFNVRIGGALIDPSLIFYAGAAPGFAGLYQINLRMPAQFPPNPEIRLEVGSATSATGILLPAN